MEYKSITVSLLIVGILTFSWYTNAFAFPHSRMSGRRGGNIFGMSSGRSGLSQHTYFGKNSTQHQLSYKSSGVRKSTLGAESGIKRNYSSIFGGNSSDSTVSNEYMSIQKDKEREGIYGEARSQDW